MNPEYLTQDQIEYICDEVKSKIYSQKLFVGRGELVVKESVNSFISHIKQQMLLHKVKPDIPQIIEKILETISPHNILPEGKFRDPYVGAGAVVGVIMTHAIGEPLTQQTMKAFHNPTASIMMMGANAAITEIINANMNRENSWMTLHFNSRYTWDEVYELRHKFVHTTISDIIIQDPNQNMRTSSYSTGVDDIEWWHIYYLNKNPDILEKFGSDETSPRKILLNRVYHRLHLNLEIIHSRKITIPDIIKVFNDKGVSVVIPSPLAIGVIDIIPVYNDVIKGECGVYDAASDDPVLINSYYCWITWLLDEIMPETVKGIRGINEMFPRTHRVLNLAVSAEDIKQIDPETIYLPLAKKLMYLSGITRERVEELFQLFFQIKNIPAVLDKEDYRNEFGLIIKNYSSPAKKLIPEMNSLLEDLPSEDDFVKACNLIYAETMGFNFEAVIVQPEIDPYMSTCNDFLINEKIFGIESLRNNICMELTKLILSSNTIAPRHLELLLDIMTYKGKYIGINYNGMSKQQKHILSRAGNERAFETILRSAITGGVDQLVYKGLDITPVTTGILTGQLMERYKKSVDPRNLLKKLQSGTSKVKNTEIQDTENKNDWVGGVETIERDFEEPEEFPEEIPETIEKIPLSLQDEFSRYNDIGGY
jgi:RNA polymerase Rpb1, domain 5